jgi:predicted transposase/invertase (TIGR01784 family)
MGKIIHNPTDKLFKHGMSDLRVARELFNDHVPSKIKTLIDFNQISCEKNTFIDPAFKATEADVLYKAKLINSDEFAYLYLLCEHQSEIDELMPFRLMVYMVRILEMHLKQHPNSR